MLNQSQTQATDDHSAPRTKQAHLGQGVHLPRLIGEPHPLPLADNRQVYGIRQIVERPNILHRVQPRLPTLGCNGPFANRCPGESGGRRAPVVNNVVTHHPASTFYLLPYRAGTINDFEASTHCARTKPPTVAMVPPK